ncbi:hypothetical protein P7C70_g126, partial [Phenoliferia sp. Uapishka_3]
MECPLLIIPIILSRYTEVGLLVVPAFAFAAHFGYLDFASRAGQKIAEEMSFTELAVERDGVEKGWTTISSDALAQLVRLKEDRFTAAFSNNLMGDTTIQTMFMGQWKERIATLKESALYHLSYDEDDREENCLNAYAHPEYPVPLGICRIPEHPRELINPEYLKQDVCSNCWASIRGTIRGLHEQIASLETFIMKKRYAPLF